MKGLAMQVTRARLDKSMTPRELAERAGVPYSAVQAMENDELDYMVGELVKVASTLGMVVDVRLGSQADLDKIAWEEVERMMNDGGQAMTAKGPVRMSGANKEPKK